jgi:hypothetical protein
MPTENQIRASRTNGVTEPGKINSSRRTRHGLLAQTVIPTEERASLFQVLLAAYRDEFQPRTKTEVSLVETMAVARWRQLRVLGVQKAVTDCEMSLQHPDIEPAPVRALLESHVSPGIVNPSEALLHYRAAYDRQFSRARAGLLALQARLSDRRSGTLSTENTPQRNEPSNELKTNDEPLPQPGSNEANEPARSIPQYGQQTRS